MTVGEKCQTAPGAVDLAVHRELISLLFGTPSVPLINGVAALVTAAVLWRIFPLRVSLGWLAVLLSTVLGRLILWFQFTVRSSNSVGMEEWARRYTLATAVSGCLWGLVAAAAFVAAEPIYSLFAAFVVGGLCAGAAIRLSPYPPAFYAYIGTSATPMVVALLLQGRAISFAMSGLLLTFVVVMILVGRENHQRLADSIRLKIEEEVLNADLQKAALELTQQIAEKEKIARALEESSERFRAIGDNALDAIVISDSRGRVVYWNPAAQRTFGFTAEESLGQSVHNLLAPPQHREWAEHQYADFASSGSGNVLGKTLRLRACRKNGTEFPVDLSVSGMNLGGIWHALGIVRDVSEQERTLEALRRREADLTTIAKLSDTLQSCRTVTEAFSIIGDYGATLFPLMNGFLAIPDGQSGFFVEASKWGLGSSCSVARIQEADCEALRADHEYQSTGSSAIQCRHLSAAGGRSCLCLPLKVRGKTRGLASLILAEGGEFDDATRQALHSFGEVVKLSLANLQLMESLAEQAFRDPLTGLFNRRYLMETMPREIRRAQRRGAPLTIAMLDIDHFKRFNDLYGHDAGDLVLANLAAQFHGDLRAEDVACRYGGEEFLLLLPECGLGAAYERMTDISAIARSRVNVFGGRTLPATTVSIGLMYVAKRMGRDRIECFEDSPTDAVTSSGQ